MLSLLLFFAQKSPSFFSTLAEAKDPFVLFLFCSFSAWIMKFSSFQTILMLELGVVLLPNRFTSYMSKNETVPGVNAY